MSEPVAMEKEGSTTRLVWSVTLLGLSAGLVLLGIVFWSLSTIQAERQRLDALQVETTRMMTSLDPYMVQARDELMDLMDRKAGVASGVTVVSRLEGVIDDYMEKEISRDSKVNHALEDLKSRLEAFTNIHRHCLDWASQEGRLSVDIPGARKRVEASLREMRATIASAEGLQRLHRALMIRDFRANEGRSRVIEVARDLIGDMTRGTEVSSIKAELADLALLCERVSSATQIDELADLKDNELTSTLNRLRRIVVDSELGSSCPYALQAKALQEFETALFGEGYSVDSNHQTVQPGTGGLYRMALERLRLLDERQVLVDEITRFFDDFRSARQNLESKAEAFSRQTTENAVNTLQRAWKTMLLVALVSSSVYILLSARVVQKVKLHILAFEKTNRDLDVRSKDLFLAIQNLKTEIVERRRIESALRESEEALMAANDQLEVRVGERTAELQHANRMLEREIGERTRVEEELRQRGEELSAALDASRRAIESAEAERDRSEKMLIEVSESKMRLEKFLADATAREMRMVELKKEVNDLLMTLGMSPRYSAPLKVEELLSGRKG